MPVVATGASGQLALASYDEAALAALGERLCGRDLQVELEHDRLRS